MYAPLFLLTAVAVLLLAGVVLLVVDDWRASKCAAEVLASEMAADDWPNHDVMVEALLAALREACGGPDAWVVVAPNRRLWSVDDPMEHGYPGGHPFPNLNDPRPAVVGIRPAAGEGSTR